ncbi:MAG: hypothetical protein M2R45_03749 [Verrucomicrobia subdivision 3 bacterium]|nr:hypothetical protein [Limisphaerales bacterium]MCS1416927.1 hypothetical protein [Limisphaerales bacterium]
MVEDFTARKFVSSGVAVCVEVSDLMNVLGNVVDEMSFAYLLMANIENDFHLLVCQPSRRFQRLPDSE